MNPRRKQRLAVIAGLFFIVSAAVGLMVYALNDNIDLFYTPTEIIEGKDGIIPKLGQRLRIGGLVVPGSVKDVGKGVDISFQLVDTGPKVEVQFSGSLPDLFREGQGIVATGILEEPNLIVAHEVLAKHDEEYMPPELAEQLKGIKHVKPTQADY